MGILDGVNWKALHVETAFGAHSAAEARQILLQERIDVLLCDIEMPGETGLDLVDWVCEKEKDIKCIFLTAHADFPYARKALQLGAVDYLLQPVSYHCIEEAIRKAAGLLKEERLAQVYAGLGKNLEREKLNFRRNLIREYLFEIRQDFESVEEELEAFGFLSVSSYRCVLMTIQKELKGQSHDFLLFGIQNVLDELLQPFASQVTVLFLENRSYFVVMSLKSSAISQKVELGIRQGLETFYRFAFRELHMDLSLYLNREAVSFRELPRAYHDLQEMHDGNVAYTCGLILIERQTTPVFRQPEFERWESLLSQGLGLTVREEVHSYLETLAEQNALTREVLSQFHEQFLRIFLNTIRSFSHTTGDVFHEIDYDAMMRAYTSLPQMLRFVDFATEYAEGGADKVSCKTPSQIQRILDYIRKNLTRNIGRSEIANALYLNPEYLSRLFKREMGIGLSEYLTQERMELAKALLKNTSFPIGIIASRVGYVNFSHFAKVFKQEFGISPSEYRKNCEKESE